MNPTTTAAAGDELLDPHLLELLADSDVPDAEQRLIDALTSAMRRFLQYARDALLNGKNPPSVDDLPDNEDAVTAAAGDEPDLERWPDKQLWQRLVENAVLPTAAAVFDASFRHQAQAADISSDRYRQQWIAKVQDRLSRNLWSDGAFEEVRYEMAEATANGESIDQIRDRIGTVLRIDAPSREIRAQINEHKRKHERVPSELYDAEREGHGVWHDSARRIARTECLPADTPIDGARITAAYKRWYEGKWVEVVTASGRKLSGTPNHPVLTVRGWVGLGELAEGDRLVCDASDVELPSASRDEHVHHPPATIGEVFDALAAVVVAERERTGQPDFHGDGMDGHVDVLRPDGVLMAGVFTPVTQSRAERVLAPADAQRVALAAGRNEFARTVPVDQGASCLEVPEWDARVDEATRNGLGVASVDLAQLVKGRSCLVRADDGLGWQVVPHALGGESGVEESVACLAPVSHDPSAADDVEHGGPVTPGLPRDSDASHSTAVELDDVVSLSVTQWSGHVYNLTTVDGYFSAHGVYTSNTIGAYNGGSFNAGRALEDATGEPRYKVWIATSDSRTRSGHRRADKQAVPLDDKFDVDGEALDYPGDPDASASNTIQCFTEDTRVEFSSLRAVTRRWYKGDLVKVRLASGNELSCTPNHPILRSDGRWTAASLLHEGDDLVHARLSGKTSGAPDEQRVPPKIGEIYRAAQMAASAERVGLTPPDLHGDGGHGEIEVVPVHGELRFHGEPASDEEVEQLGLALADQALPLRGVHGAGVDGHGPIAEPAADAVQRVRVAPGSIRSSRDRVPLVSVLEPDAVGLAAPSQLNPSGAESAGDAGAGYPELLGQGVDAGASEVALDELAGLDTILRLRPDGDPSFGEVPPQGGVADPLGFPDRLHRLASEVALDQVVSVRRVPFSGHVYNLDTGRGWYTANDTAVRNCRCTTIIVKGDEADRYNKRREAELPNRTDHRGENVAASTGNPTLDELYAPKHEEDSVSTPTPASPSWADRVVAAIPAEPPADWFADPKLTGPTKIRVNDQGRVYGHIAPWGEPHASMPGVTPPRDPYAGQYPRFHRHPVRTSDGSRVRTGPLATGGHADIAANLGGVIAHYDDPTYVVADVRAGEDEHGIWVSGALRPDASPFQVMMLDRYSISGDWRDGELVAACSVSVPGFHLDHDDEVVALAASANHRRGKLADPTPRVHHDADGHPVAIVAAGIIDPQHVEHLDMQRKADAEAWARLRAERRVQRALDSVQASARRIHAPTLTALDERIHANTRR